MRIENFSGKLFEIVGEGIMSTIEIAEGRFIPSLIIAANDDSGIIDLILMHKDSPPGDVTSCWTKPLWQSKIFVLNLKFIKPIRMEFGISFNLKTQNSLIDGIIQSRGFFLQVGKIGDTPSLLLDEPKIMLEIPDMGIDDKWNDILIDIIEAKYKKMHLSKNDIRIATYGHIKSMREIWKVRRQIDID
jgi:hypothetical protein